MKRSVVQRLGNLPSYRINDEPYDSTKLGIGRLMIQRNGLTNEGKYAGPFELSYFKTGETIGVGLNWPWVMQWSDTATSKIDWVFMADGATAAATRRIFHFTFNRLTNEWNYIGFVTCTFPTATNHTVRALRMVYNKYNTGTVEVVGAGVTGTGTAWSTERFGQGGRIGFGSTDPSEITQWFEIDSVTSNTDLALTALTDGYPAGTPYVIEELWALQATTNATVANGGLFLTKGLNPNIFNPGGYTIGAATTTDNARRNYWLKHTATNTLQIAGGMDVQSKLDANTQYVWCHQGTTTVQMYKFNIRGNLTPSLGADLTAFQLRTTASATLTGTASQSNNGRVVNAASGPGAGSDCYYFTTGSRIYRSKPLNTIGVDDSGHITGGDVQIPSWPSGNANVAGAAPSGLGAAEYADTLDMFVVNNGSSGLNKIFLGPYRTDGSAFSRMMLSSDHQQLLATNAALAANGVIDSAAGGSGGFWVENGLLYISYNSSAAGALSAIPIAADWEYVASQNGHLILPAIDLPDLYKTNTVFAQETQVIGSTSGYNLGIGTNPHRLKYRTSGIDDNSGAWTYIDQSGEFEVAGITRIQFGVEFKTIGMTGHASRVHSVGLVYDDNTSASNYQFSLNESSSSLKQFAWRHAVAFGSSVPHLRVRLYDAVTGSLLVEDDTDTPTGTWERSTDGTTYVAWTNADKSTETTYVRYTPSSIADDVQARATLMLM